MRVTATDDRRRMRWPLIAALAAAMALANPSLPASQFASVASAGQPAATAKQAPTLAPIAGAAADDQPFMVKLAAPADGTGGFAVVVTKPSSGIARWKNQLPPGAMPLDLTDNSGRPVMVFLNPPAGRYEFALSVQLPLGVSAENPTGQDPFAEDALVVTVTAPKPVVVVDPKPPAPPPPVVVVPVDPVNPVDPPAPNPDPDGIPLVVSQPGLRVLIVEETDAASRNKLTAGQRAIIMGTTKDSFRTWLKDHAELVCADKDSDFSKLPPVWGELFKRPRASVPWLAITNGKTGFEGPLPSDPKTVTELVKQIGGIK